MSLAPRIVVGRREFLRGALRSVLLCGLTAVGTLLGWRARLKPDACRKRALCAGCDLLAECDLPPAISKKLLGRGTIDERPTKNA